MSGRPRPGTYRRIDPRPECERLGHNSGQYLDVVWLNNNEDWRTRYGLVRWRGFQPKVTPGWYVVRSCPCRRGEIVRLEPYATEGEAIACRALLIEAQFVFDTTGI